MRMIRMQPIRIALEVFSEFVDVLNAVFANQLPYFQPLDFFFAAFPTLNPTDFT